MAVKDLCFEIIQKCPNNCLFCSSCAGIDKNCIIDFEVFKKVIDHFMKLGGIDEISFSGGEPFLHPNLFEMIMYCKNYGIRTVLFTSGVKYNVKMSDLELETLKRKLEEQYASYPPSEREKAVRHFMNVYRRYNDMPFSAISREEMEYLKYIGLDKIVFDFQGAERDTYNDLMGSTNFDLVESSMIRASVVGLNCDAHFVPMKKNYKELRDIIELLNIAGFPSLSILNFVPQGRGKDNADTLMMNEEEMSEFKRIYESCRYEFKGEIRVGIPLLQEDRHKCTAGLDKLVIKYDGTVLPCPAFKEYDIEVLNRMGIKTPNIYTDLEQIEVHNGTRSYPLCKKLYNFNNSIK
ncbi:MAG TPA: hypothetical protein DCE23_00565 [Firmicutes bacterium]|nr:hypothetical protein [Bacillota bacterium]